MLTRMGSKWLSRLLMERKGEAGSGVALPEVEVTFEDGTSGDLHTMTTCTEVAYDRQPKASKGSE